MLSRKLGGLLVCWMVCLVRLGLLGFAVWLSAVVFGLGAFLCVWVMLLYTESFCCSAGLPLPYI